ncbi:uncharacterized protein LOC120716087 isoform X1 [Simochromis diagramma]|uniref:uncharacterized protein LOC120716087 isoform X1 n=1 Tax=Simochromis diagramma TaxID=43689 RepID=UPI001A7E4D51|nr:uncharacterized protein LOC120716087 isoform X1 [Simochromis diagramma]
MTHFALSMFSVSIMWTQQRNFYLAIVSYLFFSSSASADFNISLVGPARCYGRVEVYNSTSRGKLCDDSWVLNDAIVVCRELKCGKALAISQSVSFNSSKEETWLADLNCSGRETSLMQCPHGRFGENGCERNKGVVVVCSETLQQPNISLASLDEVQVWGPNADAEVTKGHSFVLTCFINSSINPSHFSLIFSNIPHIKPSVNNSASFSFPVAEYKHQGNYSCVYYITLESKNLTSTESAPIHVVIKFPWLLLVYLVVPAAILLLLLVLMVVCLVIRRRRAKQREGHVQMQITATNRYEDEEEEEEEERDYVNVQPVDRNDTQEVDEDKTDDHDYENMENEDNYIGCTLLSVSIEDRAEEDTDETRDDDNYENMKDEDNYKRSTPLSVSIEDRTEEDTDETSDDDDNYENMKDEDNYKRSTPLSVSIEDRTEEDTDETSDDDNYENMKDEDNYKRSTPLSVSIEDRTEEDTDETRDDDNYENMKDEDNYKRSTPLSVSIEDRTKEDTDETSDDDNYENMKDEDNYKRSTPLSVSIEDRAEEDTDKPSDDDDDNDNDYENVTEEYAEQTVDIYGEEQKFYQIF